jgi:osmotically inducible lipoprotein OsmB
MTGNSPLHAEGIRQEKEITMSNIKQIIIFTAASALILTMAACGNTTGERAVSGAGIGAAAGAVGGALTGNMGTGALLGGAVGAAAGGLTSEKNINLGKPIWK